jgi:DNA-binding XRE family transcriptional regulator
LKTLLRPEPPTKAKQLPPLPPGVVRRRPRDYAEWRALYRWKAIPPWESQPTGYLLRLAREEAGLSQAQLAHRLRCTQQAVAQAERWESNPTVGFLRKWASAIGSELHLGFGRGSESRDR